MLFEIEAVGDSYAVSSRSFSREAAGDLGLREKQIEQWLAEHPDLLLPNEKVLVIGQSVAGQAMADILALDSYGRLIIVEIKRHRTSRETVAQLLGYAARMHGVPYAELNAIAQQYWRSADDLYTRFQATFDGQTLAREEIGRRQRVIIVAPDSDRDLRELVAWLAGYGVPIQFVPFTLYADEKAVPRFIEIEGVVTDPDPETGSEWAGDWIFNTNETYAPGAYERMFARNVAAIYGYSNGSKNLEGSRSGEKVFAYVNQQGLRAVGTIVDGEVRPGRGVFVDADGSQRDGEYHLQVRWEVIVPPNEAVTPAEAKSAGYVLPVRSVFARMKNGPVVRKLEAKLRHRLVSPATQ